MTRMLFGKFGYKVIYFWIACNAMFVLTSLYHGTLTKINVPFNPEVTLPLLKDKCFYTNFILGICGIILIDRVLKVVPGIFAGIWDNKVLKSKTKMKSPMGVYNNQLREVEKKMNSRKSYIYAALYVLIAFSFPFIDYYRIPETEASVIAHTDLRVFPLSGISTYTTYVVLYFFVVVMIYKSILLVHFLRKLHNTFDFQIRPLHPDKCGGLKPVGDFCIAINYIVFIFFIVIVAFYTLPHGEGLNLSLYFGLPLYIFFAMFFFFYPLWPIHDSMKTQKSDLSRKPDEELDSDYREMLDDIIDKGGANKIPTWPFKVSGVALFLIAVFVPVLSVIAITF